MWLSHERRSSTMNFWRMTHEGSFIDDEPTNASGWGGAISRAGALLIELPFTPW
jgi:hypothetical protein